MDDYKQHWQHIEDENQVEQLKSVSMAKPILIFKHSTRCGISASVRKKLMTTWEYPEDGPECWYLDLLNFRDISNLIAETYGVTHQSPQAILLNKGDVVWHAAHYDISAEALQNALTSI